MHLRSICALTATGLVSLAAVAPTWAASSDGAQLKHARLVYIGGQDDPVAVVFTTDKSPGTQDNDKTIRARVAVSGSSTSVHHLGSKSTCFMAPASTHIVKKLKVGGKYKVKITLGPDDSAQSFTRTLTLKRGSIDSARHAIGC